MQKITLAIITLIFLAIFVPIGFSSDSDSVVITYGETTEENHDYLDVVNDFFTNHAHVNVKNTNNKIITAKNVNDLFRGYVNKTYFIDQIYSSVLVDLNGKNDLNVVVDTSKITKINAKMYESALKTVGLSYGKVYITSPIEDSGETAISGVLDSYESVTNIEIPYNVQKVANLEIYTQAEIVDNSNITSDELADLVSVVKSKVIGENITDHTKIVNLIKNYTNESNLNITNNDVDKLADLLIEIQLVQNDANKYKNTVSGFMDGKTDSNYSIYNIMNWFNS